MSQAAVVLIFLTRCFGKHDPGPGQKIPALNGASANMARVAGFLTPPKRTPRGELKAPIRMILCLAGGVLLADRHRVTNLKEASKFEVFVIQHIAAHGYRRLRQDDTYAAAAQHIQKPSFVCAPHFPSCLSSVHHAWTAYGLVSKAIASSRRWRDEKSFSNWQTVVQHCAKTNSSLQAVMNARRLNGKTALKQLAMTRDHASLMMIHKRLPSGNYKGVYLAPIASGLKEAPYVYREPLEGPAKVVYCGQQGSGVLKGHAEGYGALSWTNGKTYVGAWQSVVRLFPYMVISWFDDEPGKSLDFFYAKGQPVRFWRGRKCVSPRLHEPATR